MSEDRSRIVTRRDFLFLAAATGSAWLIAPQASRATPRVGQAEPFSFERLVQQARELAARPYSPRPRPAAEVVARLDYDAVQNIQYRPEESLWAGMPERSPVRFFHLHRLAPEPVRIYAVENGEAREVLYDPGLFDLDIGELADGLPEDLGFAGFRLMDPERRPTDWLAFQGASYFRTSGEAGQYGLSARGIAIDTATAGAEEFPAFTAFWLEPSDGDPGAMRIHALLDGPSVAGAWRFDVRLDGGVTMDVRSEMFFRRRVERLGLAPLTSMYWFGENQPRAEADWRPEVHDSDGLAIWTGAGERIFRPLTNPPAVRLHSFVDDDPKGFGLVQRDRDFDHYLDDGAFYDRRPSLWVEPLDGWGEGAVQLLEIPTDDEVHDNIAVFWAPARRPEAGDRLSLGYRLHWRNRQPYPPEAVASVIATRTGRAGRPGESQPDSPLRRKFVIDFRGGPLSAMDARFDIEPVVTLSGGEVSDSYVVNVVGTDIWRAAFDVEFFGAEGVDMRCYLRLGERTLTETWLYHHFPLGRAT